MPDSLGGNQIPPASKGLDAAAFDFSVSPEEQRIFAGLSGDLNPLHLDDAFAQARGFPRSVVYGAMIVAKISRIIGMRMPGPSGIWSALKIEFRAPLCVGETARLSAEAVQYSEAARSLTVKIRVTSGEKLVATASALATLHARGGAAG